MFTESFSNKCSCGVGESEDSDGGKVSGEIARGKAEDDGDTNREEEFTEGEALDAVKDFSDGGFFPSDNEECGDGKGSEEIDLKGS